jgi:Peptidase A4 family
VGLRTKRIFTTALAAAALTGAACLTGMTGTASAAVAGIPAADSIAHPGGPLISASSAGGSGATTVSLNWSGYAVTSKKLFTYVHTTFVQPAITCTGQPDQWTSNWSGLDGYTSDTVEQDGTFAHCGGSGNTTPKYEAWYELFPANSVNVFAVHAGDIIDSSVTYSTTTSEFTLTISDLSTGKSSSTSATCATCARTSAEWIVERPELCNNAGTNCFLTELADYGTTTMSGDEAQLTGGNVKGVGGFNNIPIDMVDPVSGGGFISLDTVGAVTAKSFTTTWDRSGNIFPISS